MRKLGLSVFVIAITVYILKNSFFPTSSLDLKQKERKQVGLKFKIEVGHTAKNLIDKNRLATTNTLVYLYAIRDIRIA